MTAEKYATSIVKRVKCSKEKRNEIKQQLLSDITAATEQGNTIEEVIKQMGDPHELAKEFNDSLPKTEHSKYLRNKIIKISLPIAAVLIVLIILLYHMIPRTSPIEDSRFFNKETVETKMKETIQLLDQANSDALCADAIPQMQPYLSEKAMTEIKSTISDDWGERTSFGTIYMTELTQMGKHLAVGEITVTYENVSVTYRLTYDRELKLAGLYVR